jgi:hypothetical protein
MKDITIYNVLREVLSSIQTPWQLDDLYRYVSYARYSP